MASHVSVDLTKQCSIRAINFNDLTINSSELVIPHPRISESKGYWYLDCTNVSDLFTWQDGCNAMA